MAEDACRQILGAVEGIVKEFAFDVFAVGKDLPLVGAAFGLLHMIASRVDQAKVSRGRGKGHYFIMC